AAEQSDRRAGRVGDGSLSGEADGYCCALGSGLVGARRRVRIHLLDPHPEVALPSVDGVALGSWLQRRLSRDFRIAVPELQLAPAAAPERLRDARELRI